MSDHFLARAQEWLGCERGEQVDSLGHATTIPYCLEHQEWPCGEADSLASLLADVDREAYREGLRHGSDELDPDDYECCASGRCEVCRG